MGLVSTTLTVTPPAPIVAGENPVVVSLTTSTIGSPSFSKARLSVLSTATNNVTLTFALPAYTKVFTGKEYPDNDSYYLTGTLKDQNGSTIDSSISTSQIASSLADCLKKDLIISKNYYIDYTGGTVVDLVAKTASSQFNLTGRVSSSNGGVLRFSATATGADQYQGSQIPDYAMYVEVYKGDDSIQLGEAMTLSSFQRVTELVLPYSTDNIHRFDVSTVCKNFVKTGRPNFETTGYTTTQNTSGKYVLPFVFYYGESYPLVAGSNTTKKLQKGRTNQIWVCNSSLPFVSGNSMIGYTGLTNNVKLLTNSPSTKNSSRSQREILSLLIPKNLGKGLKAKANVQFWDGSVLTGQTLFTLFTGTTNYGGLYHCNVSHAFELAGYETGGKKIKYARVSINDNTGSYSVLKTYKYPYTDPANRFGVAFLNNLGTWDTHDWTGYAEETIDRTRKELTIPVSANANGSFPTGFKYSGTYDAIVTKKITVNSGWVDRAHYDWLIELMSSNEIYSYDATRVNYLNLDSVKYSKNNQTDQFNIEATFIQTIFENNVSM